ncbi:MAG: hypothetical protein IIC07_02415 [Proteobacteria bacterium]|nr:hypothetical protein [Pseudomonadota bacterium]
MSDHAKEARDKNDVLVKGGTKREVKKAAKAEYPEEKIRVRKVKRKLVEGKTKQLGKIVPHKTKEGEIKKTAGKTRTKTLQVITKGKKKKEPQRFRNVRYL